MDDNPEWQKGWRSFVSATVRYLFHVIRQFIQQQCFLRAAALTYTTLLTLIPILVLVFVVFEAFGGLDMAGKRVEAFLFTHLLPETVASVRSYIQTLVHGFNSRAVSTVSVLFLIIAAYGLFASIDTSLNAIWRIPKRRSFLSRLVNLWFILTISPLLLGYSLYLSAKIQDSQVMKMHGISAFGKNILWAMPVVLTWITLTLIFRFVPRTHIQWSSALIGGFFASVLWEFSKFGFNLYVDTFANIKMVYGSFMLLPLFLIWIDLSWLLILLGAEICFVHQNMPSLNREFHSQNNYQASQLPNPLYIGFTTIWLVTRGFLQGESPYTINLLEKRLGITREQLDAVLDVILNESILALNEDTNQLFWVKDPGTIEVAHLMQLFDGRRPVSDSGGIPEDVLNLISESGRNG